MNNVEKGNILDLKPGDVIVIGESIFEENDKKVFVVVDRINEKGVFLKRRGGIIFDTDWHELYAHFSHHGAKKLSPKEGKLAKILLFA